MTLLHYLPGGEDSHIEACHLDRGLPQDVESGFVRIFGDFESSRHYRWTKPKGPVSKYKFAILEVWRSTGPGDVVFVQRGPEGL